MSKAGEQLIAAASSAVEAIKRMKPADGRQPRRSWAPGGYLCLCRECEEHFLGDKRALQCADCAYAP
jgi:hypothetical protein